MFRPDNPLLPNYKWVPIGYHGRASSIVPSGTPVRRPHGPEQGARTPSRRCSARAGRSTTRWSWAASSDRAIALGEPVPIEQAEEHLFGFCLVNDWSARDIQTWEYQPLGPFLAKNFATTLSPWVVTLEALEPFRVPAFARPPGDPAPLPYLDSRRERRARGRWTSRSRSTSPPRACGTQGLAPVRLSRGSAADLYWTPAQMLAHHTSNGCNLRPGDLLRQRHDLRPDEGVARAACWS